jgi:xylan 1,4-beta-xylosidase
MGHRELALESSAARDPLALDAPNTAHDLSGFATLTGEDEIAILLYNHHDDWSADTAQTVELVVDNLPFVAAAVRLVHYRIDDTHSNGYTEWVRQGRPMYPTPGQYAAIQARAGLEMLEAPLRLTLLDGKVKLLLEMAAHAVSLLLIKPTVHDSVSLVLSRSLVSIRCHGR